MPRLPKSLHILNRTLHIYLTMFALIMILFYSLTGLMLNHPDWFSLDNPRTVHRTADVPPHSSPTASSSSSTFANISPPLANSPASTMPNPKPSASNSSPPAKNPTSSSNDPPAPPKSPTNSAAFPDSSPTSTPANKPPSPGNASSTPPPSSSSSPASPASSSGSPSPNAAPSASSPSPSASPSSPPPTISSSNPFLPSRSPFSACLSILTQKRHSLHFLPGLGGDCQASSLFSPLFGILSLSAQKRHFHTVNRQ